MSLVGDARQIRRIIIDESKRAGVGHIGSALSVADLLAAILAEGRHVGTDRPDRDRFILSKGHAALALYAALHLRGVVSVEDLATYCQDGTLLGVHPDHRLRGVDLSTGSLGHGLSAGVGMALAARLNGHAWRTFVLLSDAECNEGAVWEAVMFAAHQRLSSLVAIVDDNGSQALGPCREILDLSPLADKWRAFGWRVHEVDGHDPEAVADVLRTDGTPGFPRVLIARTVLGKGVSFMEGDYRWHYLPLSDADHVRAQAELARDAS